MFIIRFFIIYVIVFLFLYLTCFLIPSKKGLIGIQTNLRYIIKKYSLNLDNSKKRLLSKIIVSIDSFSLSLGIYLALFVDINIYALIGIYVALMFTMIFGLYNYIGYTLKKKGW